MIIAMLISLVFISTIIMSSKTEGTQLPLNYVSSSSKVKMTPPRDFLHEEELLSNEFDTGSLYWYTKDQDGSPTLWYRVDRMEWTSIVFKKRMQYTDVVLQSVLQKMPTEYTNMNFVLLLDDFSPMQMIKNPRIGPAFLKSFIKSCPSDCLKRAVMVTGTTGHIFYNIIKSIAPKSLVSKITVVKSREVAAPLLVKMGIIGDKDEIPTFLGGDFVHDDKLTKSLSGMLSSLN